MATYSDSASILVPIVDCGRWAAGTPAEQQRIAIALADACREFGVVYIINHGVAPPFLTEAFKWAGWFFGLDSQIKMLACPPPDIPTAHGYAYGPIEKEEIPQAMQHENKPTTAEAPTQQTSSLGPLAPDSLHQPNPQTRTFDLSANFNNPPALLATPERPTTIHWESFQCGPPSPPQPASPNTWLPPTPATLPGFRAYLEALHTALHTASQRLLAALAAGLGPHTVQPPAAAAAPAHLRLVRYAFPPWCGVQDRTVGAGGAPLLRLLSGRSRVQVLARRGDGVVPGMGLLEDEWVTVPPVRDAMVLCVGEGLARWSRGQLRATEYRVLMPEPDPPVADGEASWFEFFLAPDEVDASLPRGGDI